MATMFVRHKVADYSKWRKAYDEFGPTQAKMGVTAQAVYRNADDPNEVTVTHEFANVEAAHKFIDSPELHKAMESSGVSGEPTVWYANKN